MVESWSNAETFAAMEVPQFALVRLVFNDDGASDGAHRCIIKVERPNAVLSGRHSQGFCVLLQEINVKFSLSKYMVP